ncbi:hypothetical protein [Streptosporangium canum]|uniref:hypothetical protein n=1 Tax=Streptosporangium canum TaxID=324952 RepID=UPI003F4D3201
MTKPGLMYHFATKDALMVAVVEYSARRWEELMPARLGVPLENASPRQPTPAQHHRSGVVAVPDGGALGVVLAARATQCDHVLFQQGEHHSQARLHGQGEQAGLHRGGDVFHGQAHAG